MTPSQRDIIKNLVREELDNAESHWKRGGHQLVEARAKATADYSDVKTPLPGHPTVREDETTVDRFVCLAADIRDSSTHLMCEITPKKSAVSGLQRVFYETSALLPAWAKAIEFESGKVTEYLGDGVLAFFQLKPESQEATITSAYLAAKAIVDDVRNIANEEINERYNLPPVDAGVAMSESRAMINLVGLEDKKQATAFGQCVFRASKMANDKRNRNSIFVDDRLEAIWPKSKEGALSFTHKGFDGFSGYTIYKSER